MRCVWLILKSVILELFIYVNISVYGSCAIGTVVEIYYEREEKKNNLWVLHIHDSSSVFTSTSTVVHLNSWFVSGLDTMWLFQWK